MNQFIYIK